MKLALAMLCALAVPAAADEVILIEGAPPTPKTVVHPRKHYLPTGPLDDTFLRPAPEYSDEAKLSDTWAVAWMLLDVDATGKVARVKFLNRPGHDLDKLAVKTAFGLELDPALDDAGKAQRSWVVWPIEWPSYYWLVFKTGLASGIPDTHHVPCRGSGPLNGSLHAVYRDCSDPDLAKARTEPWITRASK